MTELKEYCGMICRHQQAMTLRTGQIAINNLESSERLPFNDACAIHYTHSILPNKTGHKLIKCGRLRSAHPTLHIGKPWGAKVAITW